MQNVTPVSVTVFAFELALAAAFGFAADSVTRVVQRWPAAVRVIVPVVLVLPYTLVSASEHMLRWQWAMLYAGLPVTIAWLLERAAKADPEQRGNWRDAVILLTLGLAVDLRWFEPAWPAGLQAVGKISLVDAGLYGFLAVRRLEGTGFDFHLRWSDWKTGLRELAMFAPVVIALGLALGFIHPHASVPSLAKALLSWAGIFLFVAIPEELFFRAWVQNLLQRRIGRIGGLIVASVLFGLSHFNKRSAHFNWRYVILATIAGIFYGRAWQKQKRVPASTITHTFVDWLWWLWF